MEDDWTAPPDDMHPRRLSCEICLNLVGMDLAATSLFVPMNTSCEAETHQPGRVIRIASEIDENGLTAIDIVRIGAYTTHGISTRETGVLISSRFSLCKTSVDISGGNDL